MPKRQSKTKRVAAIRSTGLVLPQLVAKWRSEAEYWMGELGAAIDMGSRCKIRETARTLNRCARELEEKLGRQNADLSDRAGDGGRA